MTDNDSSVRHRFEYSGVHVEVVLPSREDHISKALLADTFYEQPMLEALAGVLRPGDVVVDAGANIGNHTIYFAKVLGCRVTAFEALPATAAFLAENVRLNGLSDRVHVEAVALGARQGRARVKLYDETNIGGTTLEVGEGALPVFPLDEMARERPVRLLKIDVEGMERAVLEGAATILAEDRPWILCEAADRAAYESVKSFLDEAGYSPTAVYNATDTFLFLPSRSEVERRQVLDHVLGQVMELQRQDRRIEAGQAQAKRYVERIRRELMAEMARSVERGAEARLAGLLAEGEALQRRLDDAVTDAHRSRQALASTERRNKALAGELDEVRALLALEREQAAAQLADAERRIESGKREIESLVERSLHLREAAEEARNETRQLVLASRHEQAAHEGAMASLRAELSAEAVRERGLAARIQRELADKIRRLRDAHRVLKLRNGELVKARGMVARLEKRLEASESGRRAAEDAATAIRHSVAFRLGSLLLGARRSPMAMVALTWRVPRLISEAWEERRRLRRGGRQE
jgi:FkbM family methyltransferase